jgi:hypothetical protein
LVHFPAALLARAHPAIIARLSGKSVRQVIFKPGNALIFVV